MALEFLFSKYLTTFSKVDDLYQLSKHRKLCSKYGGPEGIDIVYNMNPSFSPMIP
jgi:hypothetical protein